MSDVPEGYKMSEVGVIHEEWEVKTLENITTEIGDGIHSTPQYVPYSDIFFVNGNNLVDNSIKITDNTMCVSEYEYNKHKKRLNDRTILLSINGTIGNIAFFNGEKVILGKSAAYINVNNSTNKIFIFYLMQSSGIKNYFEDELTGSTIRNLSLKTIRNTPIALPPTIEEQQAIASALSDVDALITALEQLITKKRNIKQGAMQQLLTGKKRLPGFSGEWEVKAIGKEIDLLTGFPFPSSQYSSSGIKLLRGSNIKRGVTDWSDDITEFWEEITPDLKNYTLNEGDIVIAMDGSLVGRSFAILSKKDLPALLLQRVARIRSNKIDVGYLKEFICSDYFSKYCDLVKTVTAIPHISPEDIRNFTILLPPSKEEQQAIAQILSDMDTEIEALKQKQDKYKAIKQGMMQELLTGKTRLV